MYILTPTLPSTSVATALLAYLATAPLPDELKAYLDKWLVDLPATEVPAVETLRLRVFGSVLADLAAQGWEFATTAVGQLRATPPYSADRPRPAGLPPVAPAEVKQALQKALVANRDLQLAEPTVQSFVRRLERPRRYRGLLVSVRHLLLHPAALAADLQACLDAPTAEARAARLQRSVQPYLQLATDEPDEHTGLRLLDIWRYCRYTWSLPWQSQPGRRMFYLVRDAARPLHPIIGIGALGSAVVQLSVRDNWIGWSLEALRQQPDPARFTALCAELDRALAELYQADFRREQLLSVADLRRPTAAVVAGLRQAARELPPANGDRRRLTTNLVQEAESGLFRKKRALVLAA